jgi:hypothetical protein
MAGPINLCGGEQRRQALGRRSITLSLVIGSLRLPVA